MMINDLQITSDQIETFAREGAVPLRGLFSADAIAELRGLITAATREPGPHRDLFSRAAYDFANEDRALEAMLRSPALSAVFDRVIGRSLYFTQTVAFDLHQGDTGFPWHIGFISFKYIRTTDYGYTLWVPLEPVASQRGEVAA